MVTATPGDCERDAEDGRFVAHRQVLSESFVRLREKVADSAAAVAQVEDRLADTLELAARTMPRRADELLEKARAAREYAAVERARVKKYRGV
jgi:hypothetical protein